MLAIKAADSKKYAQAMQAYYARHVCRDEKTLKKILNKNDPNGAMVYQTMGAI